MQKDEKCCRLVIGFLRFRCPARHFGRQHEFECSCFMELITGEVSQPVLGSMRSETSRTISHHMQIGRREIIEVSCLLNSEREY